MNLYAFLFLLSTMHDEEFEKCDEDEDYMLEDEDDTEEQEVTQSKDRCHKRGVGVNWAFFQILMQKLNNLSLRNDYKPKFTQQLV